MRPREGSLRRGEILWLRLLQPARSVLRLSEGFFHSFLIYLNQTTKIHRTRKTHTEKGRKKKKIKHRNARTCTKSRHVSSHIVNLYDAAQPQHKKVQIINKTYCRIVQNRRCVIPDCTCWLIIGVDSSTVEAAWAPRLKE